MVRKLGCQYVRAAERLSESVGLGVSWLTGLLVLVVCYDVFTRYLMQNSMVAVQEMEWHLFALVFLLGSAYSLKHDRHVRVDVFYSRFSPKRKALVNLGGSVLFLIPFCLVGIWGSQAFVISSFMIGETSPDPGGLPARFILKAAIPVGFLLVLLQGIAMSFKSLAIILGWYDDEEAAA
jgi:TRAP-type mannitol/chloroaromatic compound transport system permease small subunit